jgi:hypothetical protein
MASARGIVREGGALLKRLGGLIVVASGAAVLFGGRPKRHPSRPPSARAATLGYEPEDVNAVEMTYVLAGLLIGAGLLTRAMFLLVWIFGALGRPPQPNLTRQQTAVVEPPAPHLQIHPYADLASVRLHEEGVLNSYGWIGRDRTHAHIPIDRAMPLLVGHGLDPSP